MKIGIVGVGLIGGSIGLAMRERLGARIAGFDPAPGVLEEARERKAIDVGCDSPGAALEGAELAFVATPVGALEAAVAGALQAAGADCAVSDVGSTKRAIVAAHHDDARFIGGHPLAGAETSGVGNARGDLFEGATWFLTPTADTSGVLYERLHRAIAGLGARPEAIDAIRHDSIMAAISHVPHVLANVLVSHAARSLAGDRGPLPATGPSFRDATRVAGADGAIWNDIYLSNSDAIVEQLDGLLERLGSVRDALAAGDGLAIAAWNDAAARDRQRLLDAALADGPVHELRVSVPNRPGVVAELALALGRAGINISDMALYPTSDGREGVVALWVADAQAARAEELIAGLDLPVARA